MKIADHAGEVSRAKFVDFSRAHVSILFPAFSMQYSVRTPLPAQCPLCVFPPPPSLNRVLPFRLLVTDAKANRWHPILEEYDESKVRAVPRLDAKPCCGIGCCSQTREWGGALRRRDARFENDVSLKNFLTQIKNAAELEGVLKVAQRGGMQLDSDDEGIVKVKPRVRCVVLLETCTRACKSTQLLVHFLTLPPPPPPPPQPHFFQWSARCRSDEGRWPEAVPRQQKVTNARPTTLPCA